MSDSSGYRDPFDATGSEGVGQNGGMPPQFWNNLMAFGAATMTGANARTPQGFLANGTGPLGPLGVGLQAGMANANQTATTRSGLGLRSAETQKLLGETELQKMNLEFMKGRLNFMNQYMNDGGGVAQGPPQGPQVASATPPPSDVFIPQLYKGESSLNPANVNKKTGAAGLGQFMSSRLATLGFYNPAPDEDLKTSEWKGKFNIPGFSNVKTLPDFLQNVDAQNSVMNAHMADIDQQIAATPGADKFDWNGLRAVAHLGGTAGMQKFVTSNGQYNPDDGKTSLADYYKRFSSPSGGNQGRVAAAQPPASGAPQASPAAGSPAPQASGPAPGFDANNQPLPAGWAPQSPQASAGPAPGFAPVTGPAPYQVAQAGSGPLPTPQANQRTFQQAVTPQPQEPSSLGNVFPPGMYTPQQALDLAKQADAMGDRAAKGAMWGVPGADVEAQNQRQRAQQYRNYAQQYTLQSSKPEAGRGEGSFLIRPDAKGNLSVIQAPMVRDMMGPDNREYSVTYNTVDTGHPYVRPPDVPAWAPTGALSVIPKKLSPGEDTAQKDAAGDAFGEKSRAQYASASGTLRAMEDMEHQLDVLNANGPSWYNTGEGATFRSALGKTINGLAQSAGGPAIFDPDKLAAGEDLMKQTKLAGMQVLSTFFGGSKEAASIVNSTQGAVPGIENTPLGGKLVLNGIKEASRWQMDQHAFMTNWYNSHAGNMIGADVAFAQSRPSAAYARRGISMVRPYPVTGPEEFKRYLPGTQVYLKGTDPKSPQNIRSVPGDEDVTLPDLGDRPSGPG